MKKLYIEEVKPELEQKCINYEILANLYDATHEICIIKIKLDKQLEIGKVYAFNYIDCNDDDTYHYIVLKEENSNIYFISEYYREFITTRESLLVEGAWVKVDISELGINLSEYNIQHNK